MSCDHNQYEKVCLGQFTALHAKLDRLDEAIRGNGKPGIQLRLDRLESAQQTRSRLLWIIAGSMASVAVAAVWKVFFGG